MLLKIIKSIYIVFCAKNHPVNLQLYNLKSKDGSTWAGAWGKLTRLIPYMWPAKSASLQLRYLLPLNSMTFKIWIFNHDLTTRILEEIWFTLTFRVIFCVLLIIAVRVINVWVPIYHKIIVDALSEESIQQEVLYFQPCPGSRISSSFLAPEVLALGGSVSLGWVKSLARRWNRDWGAGKSQVKFYQKD